MNYEQAVDFIAEVPKFTKKNKRENTVELLRRLGDPQQQYQIIHVAGTNGKGSVCAFTASVLEKAGYRCGLFISPHLVKINERFQINQVPVSDDVFLQAFIEVKNAIDDMMKDGFYHPTYFEILFAVGMVIFAREKVDYLVMETGLGGRLDATNAVAHPAVCAITSISLDHTEYLGDTVEQIAWEKAGIIKEGVPVVYDGRFENIEKVIRDMAKEKHAPASGYHDGMCEVLERTDKSIDFVLNNQYYDNVRVHVPFLADYQIMNSAMAMMIVRVLDPEKKIPDQVVLDGIAQAKWGGRMETVLPGVVLDGAHNADGVEQFLRTVQRVQKEKPVSLLFTSVIEKDFEEMIRKICTEADFTSVVVTQLESDRRADMHKLSDLFRKYSKEGTVVVAKDTVKEAMQEALDRKGDGMLFCVGSLYLIGEIKALISNQSVQPH